MARLRLRIAVILAGLALCARLAQAQDSGPGFVLQGEGGLVTVLVLDPSSPSTVFASTARGVYRSADSGAHWEPRNRGLEDHSVLALAVDPAAHGTLYATTDTGGVYKSPDGGNRWTAANQGLASRYVGVVAAQGRALYAGTEGGRIFRSVDAAATWAELTPPTTRVAVTAIAVDPSDGGHLRRHQRRGRLPELGRRVDLGPRRGPAQPGDGLGPGHRSDEVLDAVRGDV